MRKLLILAFLAMSQLGAHALEEGKYVLIKVAEEDPTGTIDSGFCSVVMKDEHYFLMIENKNPDLVCSAKIFQKDQIISIFITPDSFPERNELYFVGEMYWGTEDKTGSVSGAFRAIQGGEGKFKLVPLRDAP